MAQETPRPNILWITCEDMSPNLGCFGDKYAVSPNLDRFSERALRYRNCWSNAPVCAPARTAIISGMYPPSTGSEHMRSMTRLAPGQLMFPQILRNAGYHTTNNSKEDYNLEHTGEVWNESSNKGHWRTRRPGQPFFSVFNFTITHESQIRRRPHKLVHDPAEVRIPAYHPDTPEVRHDWAQYYDNITDMDKQAGRVLDDLKKDGLDQDTIVFFYSDHGSGMPRSKRWPYNSGLGVPLMVHFPEKFRNLAPPEYQEGGITGRLISFVDLAPAVLSLAGIPKQPYHQGQAFLGRFIEPERAFVYGFRGRMDERLDMVRSVRDKRYVYIRNYMPHRIYGEHVAYMFQTPTTRKWNEMYRQGKLNEAQKKFWEPKPGEELYDLQSDPDEVRNLASSPAHKPVLERMRKAQQDLALQIRDVGFLPEDEIHSRSRQAAPYEMARDPRKFPAARIQKMAGAATLSPPSSLKQLQGGLKDPDSAVRYWAATGFLAGGKELASANAASLAECLKDPAPSVRIVAAEALARYTTGAHVGPAIEMLLDLANLEKHGFYTATMALNALDHLGPRLQGYEDRIRQLPLDSSSVHQRVKANIGNLVKHILSKT
jgi:uncharacterized sulfatase